MKISDKKLWAKFRAGRNAKERIKAAPKKCWEVQTGVAEAGSVSHLMEIDERRQLSHLPVKWVNHSRGLRAQRVVNICDKPKRRNNLR